jgi:hypothetical protein
MGERRPIGEREFSPLDDSASLIGSVMAGGTVEDIEDKPKSLESPPKIRKIKAPEATRLEEPQRLRPREGEGKEEFVTLKFKVPRSDYAQAKRIVSHLEQELGARIDLSNLGRGWITRLITAEKEIIDAARNQERLKTPNSRNALEVAEIDHAMTIIQSVAFRRAETLRDLAKK